MTETHWKTRSAIVTGGARGQGAAVVKRLLAEGATVYVVDRIGLDDPTWLPLLENQFEGQMHRCILDVGEEATWLELAQRVRESGVPLFGLLNNAGITGPRNPVTRTSPEDWDRVLRTNLTGAFHAIRHVGPLIARGGAILNVSSTTGLTGYYSAAYSTSKWGLRGLTKAASMEFAERGVRVNCICPGVVDTDMIRNNEKLYNALKSVIPVGEMASADDVASVMVFMLGPLSAYMTGTDIVVDGGVMSGGLYSSIGKAIGAL